MTFLVFKKKHDDNKNDLSKPPLQKVNGKTFFLKDIKTKMFYNLLVTRKILQSRAVPYWQQKINGFAISEDTWKNIWLFKLKYISDTRLINFNFKLMYNLIPVRKNLYKWNLADDANCTNCNIEEDVLHAFIDCAKLTPFWRWINTILKDIYPNTAINLNPHTVLFGKNLSDKLFYNYV